MILEAKNIQSLYQHQDKTVGLATSSIQVHSDEILAIVGPSGCGKSSLLRIIAGLDKAQSGTLEYLNQAYSGMHPDIAMVFQQVALIPWLDVYSNIAIALDQHDLSRYAKHKMVLNMTATIGLKGFEKTPAYQLSGGMASRVGFARALIKNPGILLLDEPFSALDAITARRLRLELMQMWHQGEIKTHAMILVTHHIEEAVLMANRILVMHDQPGTIVAEYKIKSKGEPMTQEALSYWHQKIYDTLDKYSQVA